MDIPSQNIAGLKKRYDNLLQRLMVSSPPFERFADGIDSANIASWIPDTLHNISAEILQISHELRITTKGKLFGLVAFPLDNPNPILLGKNAKEISEGFLEVVLISENVLTGLTKFEELMNERGAKVNLVGGVITPVLATPRALVADHVFGRAVDVTVDGISPEELEKWVLEMKKNKEDLPIRFTQMKNYIHVRSAYMPNFKVRMKGPKTTSCLSDLKRNRRLRFF